MYFASAVFFVSQACLVLASLYLQVMLKNLHYSYLLIGLGMALSELFGMVGPVAMGAFVDRRGGIRMVLAGLMAGTVGAVFLLADLPFLAVSLAAAALFGFCYRSAVSLQESLGMETARGDVDRYSHMRSMGTLGAVCFSLLYAALRQPDVSDNHSIFRLFLLSAVPYLALCLLGGKQQGARASRARPEKGGRWYDHTFILAVALAALNRLAMAGVAFMPLYMVDVVRKEKIMLMFTCATTSEFIAMLTAGRLIQRRVISPVSCLIIASLGIVLRMVLYAAFPTVAGVALAQCTHALCFGFYQPAMVLFVRDLVSPDDQAKGMGVMQSVCDGFMSMVGNLLCGFLVDFSGYRLMFLSCGGVAFVSALLFWVFRHRLTTT